MSEEFQKDMINRLMAVYCPNCKLELLSTIPYPASVGDEIEVRCGGCQGVGHRTMPQGWQYTDINAYPLEQATNRRIGHSPNREPMGKRTNTGQLEWD